MVSFTEIFERIQYATQTRTQTELAEVLHIRQSSISDAKRRNSVPADWYMKLFERFGLSPDWIKKGSGPMYLRTDKGYSPADAPADAPVRSEEVGCYSGMDAKNAIVPVHASGRDPQDEGTAEILGRLNIPLSFYSRDILVIRVDSTDMEPVIRENAFVGLDRARRQALSGELYGVRLPHEGVVIKKIYIDAQAQRLRLCDERRENEKFLPIEGHEAYIVGRVAWVLQHI